MNTADLFTNAQALCTALAIFATLVADFTFLDGKLVFGPVARFLSREG